MRILSVALACFFGVLFHANASIRVATYDLEGLAAIPAEATPSEEELKPLRQAAANLKPLDAEVIVLHGIPDRSTARRLAGLLKPASYQVALQCSFRQQGASSQMIGPPITVLTRKQPFAAQSMDWRSTGPIDWPGGFGFVGFHSGTNSVCVYVAHLPGEPAVDADREHPLMARRRELASQYLVHHANWLTSTLSNQLVSALITGDFIAEARGTRSEGAVRVLQQAGFKIALPSSLGIKAGPLPESPVTPPQLTALLARNAELISTSQVSSRKTAALALATYEVALVPTRPVDPVTVMAPRPIAARVVALDNSIIWLWVGGIVALCMASLFSVWLIRRTFSAAGILGRRGNSAVVLNLSPFQGRNEPYAVPRQTGESYSASTTDALWEDQLGQTERRTRRAAWLSDTLRPQLSRLLRERLVAWLSFQRRALLTSHEAGTQQVLELETRLRQVQGQFQDRLRSREERIVDLEQEVRAKEKIIRDLLRTQVRLANRAEDTAENPGPQVDGVGGGWGTPTG
jgi:hypothetical protein